MMTDPELERILNALALELHPDVWDDATRRIRHRFDVVHAEAAVLRGDECEKYGDGPCGVCRKCANGRAETYRRALQHIMQVLGPQGVLPDVDYGDPNNLAGLDAEISEALRALREVGIEYQFPRRAIYQIDPQGSGKLQRIAPDGTRTLGHLDANRQFVPDEP